jgi:putative endonuclease
MKLAIKGEQLAARYLRKKRFRILSQNFRTRYGEIDVIACRERLLVFCEVKTRTSSKFGKPVEAITPYKMERLKKLAEIYLARHLKDERITEIRFDVITITFENPKLSQVSINHLENAFDY